MISSQNLALTAPFNTKLASEQCFFQPIKHTLALKFSRNPHYLPHLYSKLNESYHFIYTLMLFGQRQRHTYIQLKLEMHILETGEKETGKSQKFLQPSPSPSNYLYQYTDLSLSSHSKTLWISLNSNIPSLLEVSLLKGFRMSLIMKENNLKMCSVASERGVRRNSILYLFLCTYNASSVFYLKFCFNHTSISKYT